MFRSIWFPFLLMQLIGEVSLKDTPVQGFIGGAVVLPCHIGSNRLKEYTVYWRYKDIKNVHDIADGKVSTTEQDSTYKSRTSTFPSEYVNGNFSLLLSNLRRTDEGRYCCFIPETGHQHCSELTLKEKPKGDQVATNPGERNHGVEMKPERVFSLLIPLFYSNIVFHI